MSSSPQAIDGQLNPTERKLLVEAVTQAPNKPKVAIEVGTWLGGGSTLHILRALEKNGIGHLWGIEAERSIYDRMLENIRAAAPEAQHRFTPLFGFSQDVLADWLPKQDPGFQVDFAFLDGGNNPREQIDEFHILDPLIPVGGQIMAHDAKMRKGRWLVPYLNCLDNWRCSLHDVSEEGLFHAQKLSPRPSPASVRKARWKLLKMQCHPVEIAATVLPASVCRVILGLMPRRLSRKVAEGRNA